MSVVWFLILQSLAIAFAMTLASWRGARELWTRILVALVAYVAVAIVAVLVAGLSGRLDVVGVTLVLLALTGALLAARVSYPRATNVPSAGSAPPAATRSPLALALQLAIAGFAGVVLFRGAVAGTEFGWDDLSYHAVLPAHWLSTRCIELPAFTYQSYFPMNAELVATWFMLPFHADAYASLVGMLFLAIASVALFGIARSQEASPTAALVVVVALLASSLTWTVATTFCAIDLAGPAFVLAALALVGRGEALVAGLALGIAIGCRPQFAAALLLIAAWRYGRGWRTPHLHVDPSWRRDVTLLLAGALVTGSFWFVRNAAVTGNPVYPLRFGPWAGPLQGAALAQIRLIDWLLDCPPAYQAELWRRLACVLTDWPNVLGVLGWLGYVTFAIGGITALRDPARRRDSYRLLLAAVGISGLVVFPWLPFSATCNRPNSPPLRSEEQRFLVLVPNVGVALLVASFQGDRLRKVGALLAAAAVIAGTPQWAPLLGSDSARWFAAGVVGSAPVVLLWRRRPGVARWCAAFLLVTAAGVVVHGSAAKQSRTDEHLFAFRAKQTTIGAAWRRLDQLAAGSRVTIFASDPLENVMIYPLFGRRWQLQPKLLDPDGSPHRHLHLEPLHDWWAAWRSRPAHLDRSTFLANLRSERIDCYFFTRWLSGETPPQARLLIASGCGRLLFADVWSMIWQVEEERGATPTFVNSTRSRPR
jgi:hypothetical protein